MTPFDPQKPCRTKSGLPARFLGKLDNPNSPFPYLFAVGYPEHESDYHYNSDGIHLNSGLRGDNQNDLENIPVKHTREISINLYDNGMITTMVLNDSPRNSMASKLIACKRITVEFEEGEGL